MENFRVFQFLKEKFSLYLNRRVFVMIITNQRASDVHDEARLCFQRISKSKS